MIGSCAVFLFLMRIAGAIQQNVTSIAICFHFLAQTNCNPKNISIFIIIFVTFLKGKA